MKKIRLTESDLENIVKQKILVNNFKKIKTPHYCEGFNLFI